MRIWRMKKKRNLTDLAINRLNISIIKNTNFQTMKMKMPNPENKT